ncbi:MAG: hypothetical protein AB8H86_11245 [Polyangiales bacterium]
MSTWSPPPNSVVRGSAHRVDAARYAGRYAAVILVLGGLFLSLAMLWTGERLFEDSLGRRIREAHAAPWEVTCFALILMGAGANKRLFGAKRRVLFALGSAVALNVGATIVLTGIPQESLALTVFAAVAAACAFIGARFSLGPWVVFAFLALGLSSTAGAGFSARLPPGSDGDWAIVSLVMGAGAALGHIPFLRGLSRSAEASEASSR